MTPSPTRRLDFSLAALSLALLGLSLITKLAGTVWLSQYLSYSDVREYSYVGDDHPASWPIARPLVLMASDNTRRFRLNASDGAAEWSAISPGDGLIHLGTRQQPYTISMLHQLRCLGILRGEVVRDGDASGGPTALGRHCLNYIKQMVLCRGDIQLESFHYASHEDPIDLFGVYECRDWGAVYDAVRENQKTYKRWKALRDL